MRRAVMSWRGRSRLFGAGDGALGCLEDAPDENIEVGKAVEAQGGVRLPKSSSPAVGVCKMASRNAAAWQLREGEKRGAG
jgi:hypothetical protein